MLFSRTLLLFTVLVSSVAAADEGAWQGSLQDGSQISIDPSTNRAVRSRNGETTPLWNGVHRLNNGAVIIVRDGVVVRDETIIEAQQEQARNRLNEACGKLVTKVCGPHSECDSNPACDPARQLQAMERAELSGSSSSGTLESSMLCLEALGNEGFFGTCTRRDSDLSRTACGRLTSKVCGKKGACQASQGCDASRQLITLEQQDLFEFPGTPSMVTAQCRKMLEQPTQLFQGCGQ